MTSLTYLLADQPSELERLQLQSRVWGPSGRRLLAEIGSCPGGLVADIGCGVLGWLRLLSEWVGAEGEVVGTDIDDNMLAIAEELVSDEGLANVRLVKDDLFASALEPGTFDLVHARFELTPLGRVSEQVEIYTRLARPGGVVVLEDPDIGSWHFNPPAAAAEELIRLMVEAFRRWGDPDAGRKQLQLFREVGIDAEVRAEVLALLPGHPYLRLPLQMVAGLKPKLQMFVDPSELERLIADAETELQDPDRWGTTFTLLQSWGRTGHTGRNKR
jgi:SAM-dependent methyltransferase